ncbi:MAG: TadE/TadG family type IV pilus assembly protein [Candidatus Acidiferrales bacterium]
MAKRKRRNSPERGQSLVEVALLAPLLLALLIGAVEMGRYAYIAILVGNAARAGAAYGAQSLIQSSCQPPFPCGIQTAADNDFVNNGQPVANLTVTSSTSCGCDNGGTVTSAICDTKINPSAGTCAAGHWVVMVSVTGSGTFSALFSFPGIPPSIAVSRTATIRVAQN